MAKKKRKKTHRSSGNTLPRRLTEGLDAVTGLLEQNELEQAHELLLQLDKNYPEQFYVMNDLAHIYSVWRDNRNLVPTCMRLLNVSPHQANIYLVLAEASQDSGYMYLATQTYRTFLERFPEHEHAEEVRGRVVRLEAGCEEILEERGFESADGFAMFLAHDELQAFFYYGNQPEAQKRALNLISRWPNFAPAYNNLSMSYYLVGDTQKAIATALRVLEFAPRNYHALANLVRFSFLNGQEEYALAYAERLRHIPTTNPDICVKQMEAYAYLGFDQLVLETFAAVLEADAAGLSIYPIASFIYHLAAVATLRTSGDEKQARGYWQDAVRHDPEMILAKDNLQELNKPVGERHAPWAFEFGSWVSSRIMDEIYKRFRFAKDFTDSTAEDKGIRALVRKFPLLEELTPALLDRGDPFGQMLAYRIATLSQDPDMAEVLRDFALGWRGPDNLRRQAAFAAMRAGTIEAGFIKLWIDGKPQDTLLMDFTITQKPTQSGDYQFPDHVQQWIEDAFYAMERDDLATAEELYTRAIAVVPDSHIILTNLASIYAMQGRMEEHERIIRQVYQKHPDYLFVIVALANMHIRDGDTVTARELLVPLLSRKTFHANEYDALCKIFVLLGYKEKNEDQVRSWLDMMARAFPDSAFVAEWRDYLDRKASEPALDEERLESIQQGKSTLQWLRKKLR
jgi:Flp pilus assembly protein TadD